MFMHEKTLSSDACDKLCNVMDSFQLKTNESPANIGGEAYGLQGSFVGEVPFDEMRWSKWLTTGLSLSMIL